MTRPWQRSSTTDGPVAPGDPDDGRQVIVTLTAAGRQVLRETRRAREGWMAKRFSDLSDDEIETLARATTILERIAAS